MDRIDREEKQGRRNTGRQKRGEDGAETERRVG